VEFAAGKVVPCRWSSPGQSLEHLGGGVSSLAGVVYRRPHTSVATACPPGSAVAGPIQSLPHAGPHSAEPHSTSRDRVRLLVAGAVITAERTALRAGCRVGS
jgi:hypothetical protein